MLNALDSLCQSFKRSEDQILFITSDEWHQNETSQQPKRISKNYEIFFNLIVNKEISTQRLYEFMMDKNIKPTEVLFSKTEKEIKTKNINFHEMRGTDFFSIYEAKLCPRLLPEILCHIFSKCLPSTLVNVALCNKQFNQLSSSNQTWKPILLRLFSKDFLELMPKGINWKTSFKFNFCILNQKEKTCLSVLEHNPPSPEEDPPFRFGPYYPKYIKDSFEKMEAIQKNDPILYKQVVSNGQLKRLKKAEVALSFLQKDDTTHVFTSLVGSFQKKSDETFKTKDKNVFMTGKEMAETLIELSNKAKTRF